MRLSDAAAVITSFALLVVLHTIMLHWSEVTNGPRTLFGLPQATDLHLAAGVAAGAIVLAVLFKESRTGVLLRASRDDETAAAAIGADIPQLRWRAFILSALIAGVAGGLWGHFITSFSPKAFYLKETFVILGMLVIGGTATVSGAVFGCFLVTFAFEGLRSIEAALEPRPDLHRAGGRADRGRARARDDRHPDPAPRRPVRDRRDRRRAPAAPHRPPRSAAHPLPSTPTNEAGP